MAVRLLLQFFSIPLGPALRVSLTWAPTMVIGWIFGPVMGVFVGVVNDSLALAISGGVWFWLYAIQEPLLTMLAGVVGGVYRLRRDKPG